MKKWAVLGFTALAAVSTSLAESKFPMRVDIDVSSKTRMEKMGAGMDGEVKVEKVQLRVKVRKSGGSNSADPVTAELYVIGKQLQTGYYGVIDVIKQEHHFDSKNDNSFEFESKMYSLPRTSGNVNVGGTYETYLVVIADKDGAVIDARSGRHIKDKGIAFIRELGPKTLFDRDGNVIGKFKPNREGFSAAAAAAMNPGNNY
ncbi:hypothetical protein [Pontiella agarivorans]|uniref:Uncharacterized protein n=1 Tax=Pontiella agarivorans TaxID=3038953 RepID=A0ABU5MYL7_9BACT|nr:hypothetical protein [Pontiella agarivorans]MDZ8119292.1 hypothetical protein [Pontiella agarivorans]